jgi:dolichol kinase
MGVLVLGVGDALASVVGRRYGRMYWPASSKTVEGSAAFVSSIFVSAWMLRLVGWVGEFSVSAADARPHAITHARPQSMRFGAALVLLGVLEGVSEQNDNLVLPVYSFIAMALLRV